MVRGLGLGADDYIMKPFNPTELVARVKAHIRIHEILLGGAAAEEREIRYRDLVISVPYRKVTVRGEEVNLKNREYELLYFLASHQGMVFSRETLLEGHGPHRKDPGEDRGKPSEAGIYPYCLGGRIQIC